MYAHSSNQIPIAVKIQIYVPNSNSNKWSGSCHWSPTEDFHEYFPRDLFDFPENERKISPLWFKISLFRWGKKKIFGLIQKKKKIRKRCSKELKKNQYFIPDFYAGKEVVFFFLRAYVQSLGFIRIRSSRFSQNSIFSTDKYLVQ